VFNGQNNSFAALPLPKQEFSYIHVAETTNSFDCTTAIEVAAALSYFWAYLIWHQDK